MKANIQQLWYLLGALDGDSTGEVALGWGCSLVVELFCEVQSYSLTTERTISIPYQNHFRVEHASSLGQLAGTLTCA